PVSPPSLSSTFTDPPPTAPYTLSLHDALPIFDRRDRQHLLHPLHDRALRLRAAPRFQPRHRLQGAVVRGAVVVGPPARGQRQPRSEEHTSELQSRFDLVCRLLLEKKKTKTK